MSATDAAAIASNGDNAIRSSTVILPVRHDLADHPCIRLAASASRVLNCRLSLSTSANPIATSAAAILRMKRYITCPSACAHLAPAVTKANPVAFNMISSDINMKTMLRRTSTPISPNAKSVPANNNPYSIGIEAIIRRGGDRGTRGQGDKGSDVYSPVRLSPCLLVSLSPCLLVPPVSFSLNLHSPIPAQVISADHPSQQHQRNQFDP